jgi:ADP-heptose:LPS heptosyltransferase
VYRNNIQLLEFETMNFVLNQGALGDVITSLPAIIAARVQYADEMKLKVWAPSWQKELLEHLLAPYGEFELLDFEKFPMKALDRQVEGFGSVAINQFAFNTHTRNRVHMVDFAFGCLLDSQPEDMQERSYPTAAKLGDRDLRTTHKGYIVFPVGATSDNKLFRASVMVPIMRWAVEHNYLPVIVGTKTSHTKVEAQGAIVPIVMRDEANSIPAELYMDLREQTTLLELRDLCGYASAVVGVDGGTLHLAGTTDTNIVYGLTTTHPRHRFIAREGNAEHKIRYIVPRDLECAGCQSNWRMSRQDFRFCAYGDNLCTEKLHPEDFINALKELGL